MTAAALAALSPAAAMATPKELYGKSIVVSWQEDRMQRLPGAAAFRPVTIGATFNVYVSTQGNVFNRRDVANPRFNPLPIKILSFLNFPFPNDSASSICCEKERLPIITKVNKIRIVLYLLLI